MDHIQINCHIDENIFKNFSNFNNFTFHKRWISLTLFPFIMIFFALVNKMTHSDLFFWIFLILGFFLPLSYLFIFKASIQKQIQYFHLETPKKAYSLLLTERGVAIENIKEKTQYSWSQIYLVARSTNAHYLYITKDKAFILPHTDIQEGITPDQLWSFFQNHVETLHTKDYRKQNT